MESGLESYLLGILISHVRRLYFASLKSTLEEIFPQAFGVGTGTNSLGLTAPLIKGVRFAFI
jgi:hypothetical protein